MRGDGFGPSRWIALAPSPDGKQLATARVDGPEHVIEIQQLVGGARREVYRVRNTQALHELKWTPDGRYLIFSMRNADQDGLWRIPVTGGAPQPMNITAPVIGKLSLHPDGRHIAFVAAQGGSQVMALENFLPKANSSK